VPYVLGSPNGASHPFCVTPTLGEEPAKANLGQTVLVLLGLGAVGLIWASSRTGKKALGESCVDLFSYDSRLPQGGTWQRGRCYATREDAEIAKRNLRASGYPASYVRIEEALTRVRRRWVSDRSTRSRHFEVASPRKPARASCVVRHPRCVDVPTRHGRNGRTSSGCCGAT
jgi:hypothetical protein